MKKWIAMILAVALLVNCAVIVTAQALERESKISAALQQELESLSDEERISVLAVLDYTRPDDDYLDQLTAEKTGLDKDELHEGKNDSGELSNWERTRISVELTYAFNFAGFFAQGTGYDYLEVRKNKNVDPFETPERLGVVFVLTKDQIYELAENEKVTGIYTVDETDLEKWFDFEPEPYYEEIDCSDIRGDVDDDCEVTIHDATFIQRYLANLKLYHFLLQNADYDGDGDVTVLDATAIQRFLVGLT